MRFLIAMLFVAACAAGSPSTPSTGDVVENPTPAPAPANSIKAIIEVFGATFCSPCKRALPEVQAELDKLAKSKRGQIEFRLYVTDVSTQAAADDYKKQLHLDAVAIPDPNARILRTRKIGTSIPCGIVLDADNKVLERFPAGASFVPKDVVAKAASQAK